MLWSHSAHIILLILAAVATWFVCGIAWRRRDAHGGKWLFLLVLAVSVWGTAAGLGELSGGLTSRFFWTRIQTIGEISSPVFFFFYALCFAQRPIGRRWLGFGTAIVPLLIVGLAFTNGFHALLWSDVALNPQTGHLVLTPGPLAWLGIVHSYLLIAAAGVVLLSAAGSMQHIYRRQAVILLLAMIPPVVTNVVTQTIMRPLGVDITPFGFAISAALIIYSMRHNHMADLVPVARGLLMDNMADGVVVLDGKGRILDLNRSGADILALPNAEAGLGQLLHTVTGATDGWQVLEERFVSGTEISVRRPAGEQTYEIKATPLPGHGDQPDGRLLILRDVSNQRHALEALETANHRLRNEIAAHERLIADLDAFGHTVAHDLKAPLGQMAGAAELLAGDGFALDPQTKQQMAEMIRSGAFKAAQIVDDLLFLATTRRQDIALEPLDMTAVMDSVLCRLQPELDGSRATVAVPQAWPAVLGNPIWIEEVWWNLLSNGLKYGGAPPRLALGCEPAGDAVRFWVRDNGDGIPPEAQAAIFTPQARLDAAHSGGHGLGLSIVRSIVEKLGGEVSVESAHVPGAGAVFAFTLPSQQGRCPPVAQPTADVRQPG